MKSIGISKQELEHFTRIYYVVKCDEEYKESGQIEINKQDYDSKWLQSFCYSLGQRFDGYHMHLDETMLDKKS